MTEEAIMERIFGGRRWKGKKESYEVDWCDHCNCAIIVCDFCKNCSCNASACSVCREDFLSFHKEVNSRIECYLTKEEILVYQKCLRLKEHILDSVRDGENKIDFKKREGQGKFSQNEEKFFKDLI